MLRTVYPKKYAHGFVMLCFVVVMQSFIMNSHKVFIHIHQGCFAGTGAIVRLPQCQWSKPDGYGTISQCITTTKHSKAKTVCIFLGIYCTVSSATIQMCYVLLLVLVVFSFRFFETDIRIGDNHREHYYKLWAQRGWYEIMTWVSHALFIFIMPIGIILVLGFSVIVVLHSAKERPIKKHNQ